MNNYFFTKWILSNDELIFLEKTKYDYEYQYCEYLPHYPSTVRDFISLKNKEQNEIIQPIERFNYTNIASQHLHNQWRKNLHGYFDGNFEFVPELNIMQSENVLISPQTGKVFQLLFDENSKHTCSKYAGKKFIIIYINEQQKLLLTTLVKKDLKIKSYGLFVDFKSLNKFNISDDGMTLLLIYENEIKIYNFQEEDGWQQENYNYHEEFLKQLLTIKLSEYVYLNEQITSFINKNNSEQIREVDGMVSFQDSHQIVYKYKGQLAFFLDIRNHKIQSIIKFKREIQSIFIDNGYIYLKEYPNNQTYQIKVGQDLPGFIPNKHFFKDGMITVYNEETDELEYYESITKMDKQQMIACLKMRNSFDPILECCEEEQNLEKLIEFAKTKNFKDLMSYSLLSRANLFFEIQQYKYYQKFYNALEKEFEQLETSDLQNQLIMYDFCQKQSECISIFDPLLDKNEIGLAQLILNHMIQQDKTGLLYRDVNSYLIKMNNKKIDLKGYLGSQLGMLMISNEWFKEYQNYDQSRITPCHLESVSQVFSNFRQIEREQNVLSDIEQWGQIEYGLIKINEKQKDFDNEIKQKQIIKVIKQISQRDPSILEIESVKMIIKFKWEKQTYKFFLWQLAIFLVFLISFIIDVFVISWNGFDSKNIVQNITRIICLTVMIQIAAYELYDYLINKKDYLNFWNLFDVLNILLYFVFFRLSKDDQSQEFVLKSLQCLIVMASFFKLCFLIRIFTKMSFLVQMLMNVFFDLRYFLLFFAIVLGALTVMIQIVVKTTNIEQEEGKEPQSNYEGIRPAAFFVLALRESIGDYDTQTIIEGSQSQKILAWLLWLIIMIVGNIVFMNFIIAVVSESYENCMERMVQSIEQAKLDMIVECESLLLESYYDDPNLFPRFILIRRPVQDGENGSGEGSEWQGFVKQMKRHFDKETLIMKTEFDKQKRSINEIRKKLEENDKQTKEAIEKANKESKEAIEKANKNSKEAIEKIDQNIQLMIKMIEGKAPEK